jgi:hypothetical protein
MIAWWVSIAGVMRIMQFMNSLVKRKIALSVTCCFLCLCTIPPANDRYYLDKAPPPAVLTVSDRDYEAEIDSCYVKVEKLWADFSNYERYAMTDCNKLLETALKLEDEVQFHKKLNLSLGLLHTIKVYSGDYTAAPIAEYYLNRYIKFYAMDPVAYLALAQLYLAYNCAAPEKTQYLLYSVEQWSESASWPYLNLLWGHYYRLCKEDPVKALDHYISYLAFNPGDKYIAHIHDSLMVVAARKQK